MMPRQLVPARAMRFHTCADIFQPCCFYSGRSAKMKKDLVKKVGKENGSCFSCSYDHVGGACRHLVFSTP